MYRSRTSYRFERNPNLPSFQELQAIDLLTPVREVLNVPKANGDYFFSVISVIKKFGPFDQVKRFTQPNNWENLRRIPVRILIGSTLWILRAFPSYRGETLYVSRAGDVALQSEMYPISVTDQDDNSYSMGDGQRDYSNTQNPEPDYTPSSADLLANVWTFNVTQHEAQLQPLFLALPKGSSTNGEIDFTVAEFKMYLICCNRRTEQDTVPHFAGVPGIDIKRPAEFLDKYSSTLIWSLRILKNALRDLEFGPQANQEEYLRIATLLQSDLSLSNPNEVGSVVDKMIDHLQELLPEDGMDWTAEGATPDRPTLSRYDVAALPSYLEPRPGQPLDDVGHQGLMFACDARGHMQYVCPSCYHLLYPSYNAEYIKNHISTLREYNILGGRVAFHPQDRTELQALCRMDTTKVGSVNELIIDTDWDATAEDLQLMHDLAEKLGLTILTISITDTPPSDSTLGPSRQSSETDASSVSQFDDITRIAQLSQPLITGLRHLTNVSERLLADLHIIFVLPAASPTRDTVSTKGPTSTYVADFHDGSIRMLEMETSQAEVSKMQSMGAFNSNLQSLTINEVDSTLTEEAISSKALAIKTILRDNPDLCLLTLNWPAREFLKAETMMESIFAEMEANSSFSTYTLLDNTADRISVTFTLPKSRDTKSIIANVTTRKNGPGLECFLDNYGSFVQVLNTNQEIEYIDVKTLQDSTTRAGSSQLANVMMPCLGDLDIETARMLQSVLLSSKATLRQLVLVGAPADDEVGNLILETLESIEPSQVILFEDYSIMDPWIGHVQDTLPDKSSVIVLDRIEDLRRIAPGHDDASLKWLKIRQDDQRHFSSSPSKVSARSPKVDQEPRRFRPSREEKPFRVLDANKKTTAVNAVPITNTSFGQVILESDIMEYYGTFDHIESNGHLVPYLTDRYYPQRLLEPKQILANYEGEMTSPDGYYDVVYTPYTGGEGNQ